MKRLEIWGDLFDIKDCFFLFGFLKMKYVEFMVYFIFVFLCCFINFLFFCNIDVKNIY